MFDHLGWGELAVLAVLALFVFGPERLPGLAADAGRTVRKVKAYVRGMTADLKTELGPEVGDLDLASLHPRALVKSMLEDDDEDDIDVPRSGGAPLAVGERPPWDPDAT